MNIRPLIWILWPSFLVAGVAEVVLFAFFSPADMALPGHGAEVSSEAVYSIGFLLLWVMCALSSALTYFVLPDQGTEDSLG